MLPRGTPGWVYEAHRNRMLMELVIGEEWRGIAWPKHVTHRRKDGKWRTPVNPPYSPKEKK